MRRERVGGIPALTHKVAANSASRFVPAITAVLVVGAIVGVRIVNGPMEGGPQTHILRWTVRTNCERSFAGSNYEASKVIERCSCIASKVWSEKGVHRSKQTEFTPAPSVIYVLSFSTATISTIEALFQDETYASCR